MDATHGTAMLCFYEWYASSPKSEDPPMRLAVVFHAIENRLELN
ncbi:hypothetical protein [Nostoc sp.]|nr:hypothetical protein [Nostoc sp. S13]